MAAPKDLDMMMRLSYGLVPHSGEHFSYGTDSALGLFDTAGQGAGGPGPPSTLL